jgi:uncharacterized protein DUF5329
MRIHNGHRTKSRIFVAVASFVQIAFIFLANAESLPGVERQRIEALIRRVAESKNLKFVRNGTIYGADTAASFLRLKWRASESDIKTARDFIDKVGSMSGTSGKPYVVRFIDGSEMTSKDFLLTELRKLEN